MSTSMDKLAKELKTMMTASDNRKPKPYDAQAEVLRVEDGIAWVHIPGGVEETPVKLTIDAKKGDAVNIHVANGSAWITGNSTNPPTDDTTANYAVNISNDVKQEVTVLNTFVTNEVVATNARFNDVEADTAKIHNLTADQINATVGYIDDLTAEEITASDISADHATVGSLDANYAEIDLANVNNAWIQNGVVKDAAISDAQIAGVSANKLTAGTIDASNITVTNLNASNITTGSITVDGITIDVANNEASIDGSYIEDGTITMNGLSQSVQDAIDGAIETFTGTVVPTLNNQPASSWNTSALRDQHIGDVYYVVNNQSEQNGYCYRFTKSGSTYSWQLIKDSDVTAALSRLTTVEGDVGDIKAFDQTMSTFKTETEGEISSLQTKTTTLETSLGDKVDTSTFNELSQTVDGNSSSITTLSTIANNNGLTTSTNITNTVNTVSQTATGNSTKISQLTTTLGTNADGTTKDGDIVHQVSAIDQDLDGLTTRVGKTEVRLNGQFATSSTSGSTTAKTATITPALTGYALEKGTTITVKFTNANTASAPTLNVNSTGAKAIKTYNGSNLSEAEYKWPAGATMSFVYDGSYWRIQDSTQLTRLSTAETNISQNATQIQSKASQSSVDSLTGRVSTAESTLTQQATAIEAKVSKDGVIAAINLSTETSGGSAAKISADKVEINGTAIFNAIKTQTDAAYDAKGSAASVAEDIPTKVSELTNDSGYQNATQVDTAITGKGYQTSSQVESAITSKGYQTASQVSTAVSDGVAGKADKTDAVARQQRIYYRKTSSGAPSKNTTWLSTSGTGYGNWSLSIPQMTSGTTKYPYLYTAIQTQTVSQKSAGTTCTCSDVLLDDTTTVIDGGTIITGSLNANTIGAGDISADRMKVNSISAINSNTGSVKISASKVEIDGTATFNAIKSSTDAAYDAKGSASAAQTAAQGYADGLATDLQAEIDAKKSVHTISTNYAYSYSAILTYSAEGYAGSSGTGAYWAVSSTEGVKAGDTVRLKVTVSDMNNTPVYIVGTVNSVQSATELKVTSHGLDTTIIDGGNILTNSIGANQIKANAVTADKLAANSITVGKMDAETQAMMPWTSDVESAPYLLRQSAGGTIDHDFTGEYDKIVGGTVAWNQLCNSASVTVQNAHKYLQKKGTTWSVGASTGTAITGLTSGSDMVCDLTAMFGTTIADYIYNLETATAGAGVAWFKALFPADYYPYDSGTLKSVQTSGHKIVGFNQWDEEWEVGGIDVITGEPYADTYIIRSKNFINVLPSTRYYVGPDSVIHELYLYDENKNYKYNVVNYASNNGLSTMPSWCKYIKFRCKQAYGTTYKNDICINISSSRNGEYEPYQSVTYPLDSSLTLRGIPKLNGNNLYYDGDTYESDGTVTRKYGIVDLGTLNWSHDGSSIFRLTGNIGAKLTSNTYSLANLICSIYPTYPQSDMANKSVAGLNWGYGVRIKDETYGSDTAAFKTAMSGVYLVYELATPTTETATSYASPQAVISQGTEEYVTTGIVPVGHETTYASGSTVNAGIVASAQINSAIQDTQSYTDDVTSTLSDSLTESISQTSTELSGKIDDVRTLANSKADSSALNNLSLQMQEYIGEGGYIYAQNGTLIIATGQNIGNFKIGLTGQQIVFYENDVAVAYIEGKKMYITRSEVTDEQKISNFAFKKRDGGRFTLMYVGG